MDRNLHIEDGFVYFLHGWMQVVAGFFILTYLTESFWK